MKDILDQKPIIPKEGASRPSVDAAVHSRLSSEAVAKLEDNQVAKKNPETSREQTLTDLNKAKTQESPKTPEEQTKERPDHPWERFRSYFKDSPPLFQKFRDSFTLTLNGIGIALNAAAVFSGIFKGVPEKAAKALDSGAEMFSRYVVPFSFLWNGVESAAGNRFLEAAVRVVPATLFWVLPFYNFNLATGLSSGFNYWLEMANNRKDKISDKNPIENAKDTVKAVAKVFTDFVQGKTQGGESWLDIVSAFGMTLGGLGGLAFAAKERTSIAARVFGLMRNFGGICGDFSFMGGKGIPDKRKKHIRRVGSSCLLASVTNMIMRFVPEKISRILNHIAIAADDFGLTYWAHLSKVFNDEAGGEYAAA